jgi:hypothetical protein
MALPRSNRLIDFPNPASPNSFQLPAGLTTYLRPRFRSQMAVGSQQSFVDRESGPCALGGRDNSQLNISGDVASNVDAWDAGRAVLFASDTFLVVGAAKAFEKC